MNRRHARAGRWVAEHVLDHMKRMLDLSPGWLHGVSRRNPRQSQLIRRRGRAQTALYTRAPNRPSMG